jgi:predicted cobalt transporter CbtA
MVRTLLMRGMLIGFVAGVLAFGFAKLIGEPQVDRAIAFENQMNQAKGEAPETEIVSRAVQSGIGLFTGVVVYGTALGGLFALVFAFAYGRVGCLSPRGTAALLACAGFIAIVVVPALKYPPNPPAVGEPETIGYRTEVYFLMIVISITAVIAAMTIRRHLIGRFGSWNAALIGAATFIVIVAVAQLLLPSINEVPDQFPAVVLWRFRIASLGIEFVLWTVIGLLFGLVAERVLADAPGNWLPHES